LADSMVRTVCNMAMIAAVVEPVGRYANWSSKSIADWRRQLGRPRITWLSTVQQDLKHHHLTLPETAHFLRTVLCGGWCRRMALRNRELHARNDDDERRCRALRAVFGKMLKNTVWLWPCYRVSTILEIYWNLKPRLSWKSRGFKCKYLAMTVKNWRVLEFIVFFDFVVTS